MREAVFNETLQLGIVVRDLEATMRRYVDDYGIGPWQEFSGTVSGERVAYLLDWTGPTTVREVLESWARNVSCVTRERCATVDEADTQT